MAYSKSETIRLPMPIRTIWYIWKSASGKMVVSTDQTAEQTRTLVSAGTYGENPHYIQDLVKGRCATTSMSAYKDEYEVYTPGVADITRDYSANDAGKRMRVEGCLTAEHLTAPSDPSSLLTTSADNKAKTYFLHKLIETQQQFSSGTFLGELVETLRMIRGSARAIAKGIDSYSDDVNKRYRRIQKELREQRRRRARGLKALPKGQAPTLSDLWLQHSFGWKPFMKDIEDASFALSRAVELDRTWTQKRIYAQGQTDTASASVTKEISGFYAKTPLMVEIHSFTRVEVIYLGAVRNSAMNATVLAKRLYGFNAEDFLPTVWELIPYSFLVDYFTNIGDIISGWSWRRAGLEWSQQTVRKSRSRVVRTYQGTEGHDATGYWRWTDFSPSVSKRTRSSVDRSRYYGDFTPTLTFQLPGFGGQVINLAALARARTRLVHR